MSTEQKKVKTDMIGKCPKCDGWSLSYGDVIIDGDKYYIPYECDECGSVGKEWYTTTYLETVED